MSGKIEAIYEDIDSMSIIKMKTSEKRIILRALGLLLIASLAAIPGILLYIFVDADIPAILVLYVALLGALTSILLTVLILIGIGCLVSYLLNGGNNSKEN